MLRNIMYKLNHTREKGLYFVRLHISWIRNVLLADYSFVNAKEAKLQLDFIILMADKDKNDNSVHYGSSQCR